MEANPSAEASRTSALDLDELLGQSQLTKGHWFVAGLCFLIMMVDGYDLYIMVQLMPAIADSFAVPTAMITTAYAAQTLGQACGAFFISPLADRLGRKPLLLTCLALLGTATGIGTFGMTVELFTASRFVSGALGGAVMPIAISLAADFAPAKWRATMVGVSYAGLGVGSVCAAGVVGLFLDDHGWRALFWAGALLPLILCAVFALFGMESVRFRARKNRADRRIAPSLRRLGVTTTEGAEFYVSSDQAGKKSISIIDIFRGPRAAVTLILTGAAMCSLTASTLFVMVPTFYHELAGIPLAEMAKLLAIFYGIALPLSFAYGTIMDKFGGFRMIAIYAIFAILFLAGLSTTSFGEWQFTALFIASGFCINGALQSLNILAPTLFPSAMRATALGWKAGSGRFASTAAPLMAGVILTHKLPLPLVLGIIGAPILVLAIAIPLLKRAFDFVERKTATLTPEADAVQ